MGYRASVKSFLSIAARTPRDTHQLGARIAKQLQPGACVTLQGPLGVGKTELARAVVRDVMADDALDVPSPTFNIVQWYEGRLPLIHVDLYRLEHPEEWFELGIDDALTQSAAIIEWPSRATGFLPAQRLDIVGSIAPDETRLWRLAGQSDWQRRLLSEETL